jgi:hypothetical protein
MRIPIGVFLLLATTASHVSAQAQTPVVFVEGVLLADLDPAGSGQGGIRPAGGGTFAFRVNPRYSVRLDVEISDAYATANNYSVRIGDHIDAGSTRRSEQQNFYAILIGRHVQANRVLELTILGGLSSTDGESRISGFTEVRSMDGGTLTHSVVDQHWRNYSGALSGGVDAAFALSPHLALVSELRIHAFPFADVPPTVMARPRVAVRWSF